MSSTFLSLYWGFTLIGLVIIERLLKTTNEITLLLFGFLIGTFSLIFFNFIDVIIVKLFFLAIQAMALSGVFSLVIAISAYENQKHSGTIIGFSVGAAIFGSIIFQPLLGFVAERLGKDYIMYVILIAALIATCLSFLLYRLINKRYNIRLKLFH